jgi:hypothetical protein
LHDLASISRLNVRIVTKNCVFDTKTIFMAKRGIGRLTHWPERNWDTVASRPKLLQNNSKPAVGKNCLQRKIFSLYLWNRCPIDMIPSSDSRSCPWLSFALFSVLPFHAGSTIADSVKGLTENACSGGSYRKERLNLNLTNKFVLIHFTTVLICHIPKITSRPYLQ